MEIITSRTNSLADATRSTLGDKTKAEHIQSLRRQAKQWRTVGASAGIAVKEDQQTRCI